MNNDRNSDDETSEMFFDNLIERRWLSTCEASGYLSMTENALRIMVHRGKIKAYKLGRRLRFKLQDLDRLLNRKEFVYG